MRIITILGPSQAGKTTLARALAGMEGHAGAPFQINDVAEVHEFTFMEEPWAAIDIAGGVENLSLMGPALAGSDAAIICTPAEADAAMLAAPFFRLVEEAGVPAFLFVNGVDKAASRISEIISALQPYSTHTIMLRQVPMRSGDEIVGAVDLISERAWKYQEGKPSVLVELPQEILPREEMARGELLESLADYDDHLLEQLIEDQAPMAKEVYEVATRTLQHCDLVPALIGSALHGNGLMRLMKSLRHEAPDYEATRKRLAPRGEALAAGLVADLVKHLGKVVLVRALDEGVGNGEMLGGANIGSITGLDGKTPKSRLAPGEIGLTVKTDHLRLGCYYTRTEEIPLPDWSRHHAPTYARVVVPTSDRDETRLSSSLERLSEIDPGFNATQDETTGQIVLKTQGPLHLRRLLKKLQDDMGIEVDQGPVPVALRETLKKPVEWHHRHRKQSGGAGQFADVLIELRPLARGSGIAFDEVVKGGAVPRNYIPAVEAGVREAFTEGPGGAQVIDVSVTLKDGKHHSVDSSDFAFRTAGKNAAREAMRDAGTTTLQPIAKVWISVPSVLTGGLVPLVSGLKGQVGGFDRHPTATGWDVFECLLPMAMLDELYQELGRASRGTGFFMAEFDHYQEASQHDIAALEKAQTVKA